LFLATDSLNAPTQNASATLWDWTTEWRLQNLQINNQFGAKLKIETGGFCYLFFTPLQVTPEKS
jgi:hypothetical protein